MRKVHRHNRAMNRDYTDLGRTRYEPLIPIGSHNQVWTGIAERTRGMLDASNFKIVRRHVVSRARRAHGKVWYNKIAHKSWTKDSPHLVNAYLHNYRRATRPTNRKFNQEKIQKLLNKIRSFPGYENYE
jgi:hypothetical protein